MPEIPEWVVTAAGALGVGALLRIGVKAFVDRRQNTAVAVSAEQDGLAAAGENYFKVMQEMGKLSERLMECMNKHQQATATLATHRRESEERFMVLESLHQQDAEELRQCKEGREAITTAFYALRNRQKRAGEALMQEDDSNS